MKRFCLITFSVVFVLLVSGLTVSAGTPTMVNYQGQLSDISGDPVDTIVAIVFTIYTDSVGSTVKWTESHGTVMVIDGLFEVMLGMTVPIDDSVFADNKRYLGIKVGSDPEIIPRTRFVTVPYAYRVTTVDGATGGNITGDLTVTEDIGIGTTGPLARLDVSSTSTSGGFRIAKFSSDPDPGSYNHIEVGRTSTTDGTKFGYLHDNASSLSGAFMGDTPSSGVFVKKGGDVGIGTTSPGEKLEVNGSFKAASGSITGDLTVAEDIGIGTTGPLARLDVSSTSTSGGFRIAKFSSDPDPGSYNHIEVGRTSTTDGTKFGYLHDNASSLSGAFMGDTPSSGVFVKKGGDVGIGTTSPGEKLTVNGMVEAVSGIKTGDANSGDGMRFGSKFSGAADINPIVTCYSGYIWWDYSTKELKLVETNAGNNYCHYIVGKNEGSGMTWSSSLVSGGSTRVLATLNSNGECAIVEVSSEISNGGYIRLYCMYSNLKLIAHYSYRYQ